MEKSVKYWLDISQYDLETAEAMLDKERFLYVGFMCHQAIEKIAKSLLPASTGSASAENPQHHSVDAAIRFVPASFRYAKRIYRNPATVEY